MSESGEKPKSGEKLGSGDILILSTVLPNLPDRDELLKTARGENIVPFPRQIGKEKWEFEIKKSSAGEQDVLFILMHTKDDAGQQTTYGIITDPEILQIKGRVIGPRHGPMINSYDQPMDFKQTVSKFREMALKKVKANLSPKAKPANRSLTQPARKLH